jgi:hypothetical protein
MNPKFYYRVHKNTPVVPILNQINPVHTTRSLFPKIHFNIILAPTSFFPIGFSDFPTDVLYIYLSSAMRATCPVKLTTHP